MVETLAAAGVCTVKKNPTTGASRETVAVTQPRCAIVVVFSVMLAAAAATPAPNARKTMALLHRHVIDIDIFQLRS